MRAKKTFSNVVWGFIYEIAALVCGFVLPRLILTSFGSDYNGVTSTIRQFLQIIVIFQAGIGGVTMAALFKPLADKDVVKISVIVKTTEGFLRKVVLIFLGAIAVIACLYPFLVADEFDWFFTASLVVIMSLSTCVQYFFGQSYQLLLSADQYQKLNSIADCFKIISNTLIAAVMIDMGFGIRAVKLVSAIVFIIPPLLISYYAKKKYKIIHDVKRDNSVIKQRWDNFGQQVATFINLNTDLVILSFFLNAFEISVYAVYRLITSGVYGLFTPLTKGVSAAFGNMLAKEEHDLLKINLKVYEQVVFFAATFLFSVVLVMGLPFVSLFTAGVVDADYHRPMLLYAITAATMFRCFRFPYDGIVRAAGHFKQTRNQAFMEAVINIVVSVSLVYMTGIVGVAFGSLAAYIFRTIRLASYVSKNLIPRKLWFLFKRLILSLSCVALTFGIFNIIHLNDATGVLLWIINAVIVSTAALALAALVELLFYRSDMKVLLRIAKGVLHKRKLQT